MIHSTTAAVCTSVLAVSLLTTCTTPMPDHWIDTLPDVREFTRVARSLAALDAVLAPAGASRYHSFQTQWAPGEMLASMRNGSGDHWFALITSAGIAMHGLAHESPTFVPGEPRPWVFASLPAPFHAPFLREPAFDTANSTWCLWRLTNDDRWRRGPVPPDADDGAREQLALLLAGAAAYHAWAQENYEIELSRADVEAVFRHEPMTDELAKRLNPAVDLTALRADLREIGYPESASAAPR